LPGADRGGARRSLAQALTLCLSLLSAPASAAASKAAPQPKSRAAPAKVALLSGKGPRRTPPQPDIRKPAAALRRQPAEPQRQVHLASLDPRQVAHPESPREVRIARMRARVQEVLRGPVLGRMRVGLEVMDTQTGEVLLSHNADAAFNPASNTKILTTAAAMKLLGSDWRYRTLLLIADRPQATASLGAVDGDAPGVLRGDLFLQGSGDPTLGSKGLTELARTLARAGITRVEGDVLCDGQYRSLEDLVRNGSAPALGGGALSVHRNAYAVHISPGVAGKPASVWVEPRTPYFVVQSKVQTVRGKKGRLLIDHARGKDGRLYITVRGRLGERHGEAVERRRLPEGSAFAALALSQALQDVGITITGQVRVAPPPQGPLRLLAEHGAPLSEVCKLSNKDSNNFVADTIFKTLGGERFGLPGTLQKGARAVAEWLTQTGINPARIKIVNGSGLTHENRLRPDDLSHLLRHVYHDLEVAPEFLQSLAIGGVDGTIRYRFRGPTVGLVRAKTGTLSGVSALSGYVGEKQGVLVFSILVEGFRPKRLDDVRHAQVLIVDSLLRFLRSEAGAADVPPPSPAPTEDEPRDSESDGDPT
jgi:D-alanyl-D-alanine carboxypeptidase/D-alanyl-D-alanine-endopeptidase (penicillin-binding protein 4)